MTGLRKTLLRSLGVIAMAFMGNTASAATYTAADSAAFTSLLTSTVMGDTIVLNAGTTYTGTFTLPNKTPGTPPNDYITIRSSAIASLPASGIRVGLTNAANMPKIRPANTGSSAIQTAVSAHHYKLIGLEVISFSNPAVSITNDLIALGSGTYTSLTQVPTNIVIDRCIVRADSATQQIKRGIALNSGQTDIVDSYISGFKVLGQEAQAISGWNGPGPYNITNNYIEGAGENMMIGGTDPAIANLVPSNIVVTKNHFFKPLTWNPNHGSYAGSLWSVKNIFELKNARNVTVEGNIFENNWVQSQDGTAILFTVRNQSGTAPWCIVENVNFRKNILRGTKSAFNTLGKDTNFPSGLGNHIAIENNLIYDVGAAVWGSGGGGILYKLLNQSDYMSFKHNTSFHTGNVTTIDGAADAHTNFSFTDNLQAHNTYGVIGTGQGIGNATLNHFFLNAVFTKNVLMGGNATSYNQYAGNYFPANWSTVLVNQATPGTNFAGWKVLGWDQPTNFVTYPYNNAGTDGKDIGCNIDEVVTATAGCVSGVWGSTQVTKVLKNGVNGYTGSISFHVSGQAPTTHYGPSVYQQVLNNWLGSGGYVSRPFYKLDLAQGANAIPAGATIDSATLRVPVTYSTGSTDRTVKIHRVAPVGGAFTVNYVTATKNTYNGTNAWTGGANAGGDVADTNNDFLDTPDSSATLPAAGSTGDLTFNVTSSVQAWVNGTSNQGWLMITGSTTALTVYLGATSDLTGSVDYPELTITYH